MPIDSKAEIEDAGAVPAAAGSPGGPGPWASVPGPAATRLRLPVTGMEAEFNVFLDGVEIDPREFWGHPTAFIECPLLRREKSSFQLPTGGAVYFDRGVIEVVTPVIELSPGCAARVVRNLWEQIAFVRRELSKWEKRTGRHIRLKAYSSHYNVSFNLPPARQNGQRNVRRLAYLLAHLLPVPVAVVGTNRRSTGVGVRPRGDRIEVTADFTPDPGLMIATATLVIGIVREVMSWPSYDVSLLDRLPVPTVEGMVPGKHTTRKGWLAKDFHFPQSPFTSDVDAPIWKVRARSRLLSLREIALRTAWHFRRSIRRYADPFSFRMLFSILRGRAPSLLELDDRPSAYEDVGRLCRWGMVLPALKGFESRRRPSAARQLVWNVGTLDEFIAAREQERAQYAAQRRLRVPVAARASAPAARTEESARDAATVAGGAPAPTAEAAKPKPRATRRPAVPEVAPRRGNGSGRARPAAPQPPATLAVGRRAPSPDRRQRERRGRQDPIPFPDRRLTRSAYEQVFLKLVSGDRLLIGRETYTPVGMKGWYHAVFRRDADGRERLLTIDQLLKKMNDWLP
jgi:hypothetical protein